VRWHAGDVAEPAAARELVGRTRPDLVYHLAGSVAPSRERAHLLPSLRDNVVATINVLTAATEVGCERIVVIPSLEEPVGVGDEAVPSSPYAASKWAAGGYARMFHLLYDAPVVSARLMMMYGSHQAPTKVIPYVILSMLRGEAPELGSGRRGIDWIYASDVAEGLLAAGVTPGVEGGTYDIGTGRLTPLRSVVEILDRLIAPELPARFGALADRRAEPVRAADAEATRAALGWSATTSLEDGLARTVEWYREAHRRTG
jgi:nucleoside-diphosphate-sugar epimerase